MQKKIVEYGWDVPYPDFVRDNIREMEKQPFDGIIFRTKGFDHVFDIRPWEADKLKPQLDTLAQIEWGKFQHNFLTLYAANKKGMNWFDDEHWKTIEENMKLFSLAVKSGKCVGVCFDPEPYGTDPWVYPGSYKDKSFKDVCTQVRKRGKQFIRALQEHTDGLKLLGFFQFGLYDGILDEPDPKKLQEKLSKQWMVLLPAFYVGILEGAGPKTILIDGNESAYYYESSKQFYRAYHTIRQRALNLVPEELREKYNAQVQAGMALYIDQAMAKRTVQTTSHFMELAEQLKFFEHNVYYALTTTDEYVWCYSERMNWWSTAQTTRYPGLPEGVKASLVSARKKYEQGAALGIDIKEMIDKARKKRAMASVSTEGSPKQTDLFISGQGGYKAYRIPALVVSNKGTILAICEARKNSFSDKGDIDLAIKRSFDNGETWTEMKIIWDDGENTVGNPCPVVDRQTGIIWLPFCRNNKRVFITKSTDDGATWSTPVEITPSVSKPEWTWYATGPGHGIQLKSGRLLIPCDHKINNATKVNPEWYFSHVIYSDDHGKNWKLGGILDEKTNECQAIETEDDSVYLNIRSYEDKNRRAYAWSYNGGLTWSEVKLEQTMIAPKCQASLARFTDKEHYGKNRVLFSSPAARERENMTIRLSYDECRSWPVSRTLHPGPTAYSELAVAPDMTICCFYERGDKDKYEKITFARFDLKWLTDGKDSLD